MRGRRSARLNAAVLVIGVAVGIAVALTRGGSAPAAAYSTSPSAWTLPRLAGGGHAALADFRGRPLVVDFFASWCTACRQELPELLGVSRSTGGQVTFVGVDSEENGNGLALAQETGITTWPLVRDVGGSQQSGLRDALESIPGMPITAFYDSHGHLLTVRLGALSADALRAQLHQLYGI